MANGKMMEVDDLLKVILDDEFSNVTFTGGDPFYQVEGFTELARKIKENSDKTIWCYTGFTIEEIRADSRLSMMLPYLDVIVDGPFIMALKDKELLFRGSSNQRIIYLNGKKEDSIPGTVKTIPAK